MKNNPLLAFRVSVLVLIGIPFCFFILSVVTGNWRFFQFSIAPSIIAGLTGLLLARKELKKKD